MQCKCKTCKTKFETEAPSRIENPICAGCLSIERKKPVHVGLPPDFHNVQEELRKEFGKCPLCPSPLVPLQSFKADGVFYCERCYSGIAEHR